MHKPDLINSYDLGERENIPAADKGPQCSTNSLNQLHKSA